MGCGDVVGCGGATACVGFHGPPCSHVLRSTATPWVATMPWAAAVPRVAAGCGDAVVCGDALNCRVAKSRGGQLSCSGPVGCGDPMSCWAAEIPCAAEIPWASAIPTSGGAPMGGNDPMGCCDPVGCGDAMGCGDATGCGDRAWVAGIPQVAARPWAPHESSRTSSQPSRPTGAPAEESRSSRCTALRSSPERRPHKPSEGRPKFGRIFAGIAPTPVSFGRTLGIFPRFGQFRSNMANLGAWPGMAKSGR